MNKNAVNKLLEALNEGTKLKKDSFSEYIAFHGIGAAYNKRWLGNIVPADLLRLSVKEAVDIILKPRITGIIGDDWQIILKLTTVQ